MAARKAFGRRCAVIALSVAVVMPAAVSRSAWNESKLRVDGSVAFLSGAVTRYQLRRLRQADPALSHLVLNSIGGDALAAMEIAREVRRRALTTYVGPHSQCVSACTLIFQAGKVRIVHPRAFFAYHQPQPQDERGTPGPLLRNARDRFRALYTQLGLPPWVIDEFWHPEVMVYYGADELLERNVATIITDMGLANR